MSTGVVQCDQPVYDPKYSINTASFLFCLVLHIHTNVYMYMVYGVGVDNQCMKLISRIPLKDRRNKDKTVISSPSPVSQKLQRDQYTCSQHTWVGVQTDLI